MRVAFAVPLALLLVSCGGAKEDVEVEGPDAAAAPAPATPAVAVTPIPVPSDPKADYGLISVSPMDNGHLQFTTRRLGPSGESYARREVDCKGMTFRYLAEGDTMEDIAVDDADPGSMGTLETGSISWEVARFACARG